MDRARRHNSLLRHAAAILLTGMLVSALPFRATGQDVLVGATTDIAREYQQTEIPVFSVSSPGCGLFQDGWENLGSLGGQVSLVSQSGNRLGLTMRLALSPASGLLTAPAPEAFTFSREISNDSVAIMRASHEYRMEIKSLSLRLDFLLDYAISERLHIHLGPSFSFVIGTTVTQSDYITDAVYRFAGGAREQEMLRTEILVPQKLIIGGRGSVSYAIPVSDNTFFVPELLIRTEFTPTFQQADRLAFGPGVGFSVLTRFSDGPSERDTLVNDVPPPDTAIPLPLRASIALHGTDELGRTLSWGRIRLYETQRRTAAGGEWRTERYTAPPTLLIEPDYASASGIKEWNILFRYKGEIIGKTSSREDDQPTAMNWKILNEEESDTAHILAAELTVTDSAGATVTTTDAIPLRIERLIRIVDDRGDSILYTLYPITEDSIQTTNQNNLALYEAAESATEGGKIEVLRVMQRNEDGSAPDIDITSPLALQAAHATERLLRFLEEKGKRVPVETGIRLVEAPVYTGMAGEEGTRQGIEIVLVR